jgi:single-strand DNA-binding protein
VVQWRRDDGQVFVNVEIEADAVGHDLTFGTTAFARVGMGRPAESWPPGDGVGPQPGRPDDPADPDHLGDPESDPYVVDGGPGRGPGEVGTGTADETAPKGVGRVEPATDTGPLVRPGKGAAA